MTETPAPPDPKRARFPLAEQAAEAHRELTLRYRVYETRVRTGQMRQAEADRAIALMRAIRDTLRLLARYEPAVRSALEFALRREAENEEIAALKDDPAVAAVLEAFPGAAIGAVRKTDPAYPPAA